MHLITTSSRITGIDLNNSLQVRVWCHRLKCTEDELRQAVSSVGPSYFAIERAIQGGLQQITA